MKNFTLIFSIAFLSQIFLLIPKALSQTQYFVLQEIVHNKTDNRGRAPDKVEIDSKGGIVEFSVTYNSDCTERYRFQFTFDQDMQVLESQKEYGFTSRASRLQGNCNIYPVRDPFVKAGAANGSSSALMAGTGYKPIVNGMGMARGWDRLYINGAFKGSKTGSLSGAFMGARANKVGAYSYLLFTISGASNIGYDKGFQYEVLFVYKIEDTAPVIPAGDMTCPPPDCSGFPGTVPVWNFQTQRGECWCPEGMTWDKMAGKCVSK